MKNLFKILQKYQADYDFIAECVYGYLSEHCPDEREFMEELLELIKDGDERGD